ncbi:solute carrier family 35 member E2B-like isoform X2 [Liolophura sinensis]|uniref:solute carrier family 35 member E2B-like isoform X2 n=1 Tax=Liolophura sinensis TaxID=3198878 RepID=UPI0031586573
MDDATVPFPGEASTTARERRDIGRENTGLSGSEASVTLRKGALFNVAAFAALIIWYLFSAGTLFLNKYILSFLGGDPTLLGTSQICTTTVLGFCQIYFGIGTFKSHEKSERPPRFWRNMGLLGGMRIMTVLLGLVSLKFVAVSFTETVKGSAPVFTVLISWFLMREYTSLWTFLSLVPIMTGLVLCSAFEISINTLGFVAALLTNITDCFQNVFSKRLMSGENYKYTPLELQFYTSLASISVQLPLAVFTMNNLAMKILDSHLAGMLILDGICFHCQSLSAYILMDFISPVTHSVGF